MEKVHADATSWQGYRDLDGTWSEAAVVDGNVAVFAILGARLDDAELAQLADDLRRG